MEGYDDCIGEYIVRTRGGIIMLGPTCLRPQFPFPVNTGFLGLALLPRYDQSILGLAFAATCTMASSFWVTSGSIFS